MKTMLALALLPVLSSVARSQDTPWNELAPGDRVEVTFQSGATIRGTLVVSSPKTTLVDYSHESALTLDVTWEYPGLNGTLTVPRKEFRSVRKLEVLDQATLENLSRIKKQIADVNAKPALPKPVTQKPVPEAAPVTASPGEKPAKEAEELKKARDFFAKFPPPYWGPVRHTMDVQKQARGQALSPAEREFEDGFPTLWEKGQAASAANPGEPEKP